MRFAAFCLAPLVLATLSACAAHPRAADVRLPGGYEAPAGAPPGAIALDTWWTAFDDAELTSLVEQALARNPDVRTARSRLDEARAQRSAGIFQYLPQGDARAAFNKTRTEQISGTVANIPGFSTSGTSERYSATFDVSWEVDPWGRGFIAYDAATAEVDRVRFGYEAARALVASNVADAWFLARGLAIQLADAQQTARIQQELYDAATKRAQVGISPTSEADRIAGELSQAKANVTQLEAQLQVQKRAILILAGRVIEPTANLNAPPQVGQPPAVPAAIPSELLERRPDIRQAQAAVRSNTRQETLANLAFFPSFILSPGLGWSKIVQPNFSSETSSWTLGGSAMQPVLSIPRLLAERKAQSARTEQAVTAYEKTVQTAFQEAENALVTLDSDKRRVAEFTDGEARSRRAFEAARIGYDRGLTDLNTLLQTEESWRQIRTQLTAAQVQALRRTVQVYKALGGGWPAQTYAQAR